MVLTILVQFVHEARQVREVLGQQVFRDAVGVERDLVFHQVLQIFGEILEVVGGSSADVQAETPDWRKAVNKIATVITVEWSYPIETIAKAPMHSTAGWFQFLVLRNLFR